MDDLEELQLYWITGLDTAKRNSHWQISLTSFMVKTEKNKEIYKGLYQHAHVEGNSTTTALHSLMEAVENTINENGKEALSHFYSSGTGGKEDSRIKCYESMKFVDKKVVKPTSSEGLMVIMQEFPEAEMITYVPKNMDEKYSMEEPVLLEQSKEDIQVVFGMLTGLGPLGKHLTKIVLSQTDRGRLCGETEESVEHNRNHI
ncbi:hypothetical protein J6590_070968 [Homalodisca vitripennis]|nr:hypothetical protein J6590_070968 [Homalodisca vitripennis]